MSLSHLRTKSRRLQAIGGVHMKIKLLDIDLAKNVFRIAVPNSVVI